MTVSKNFLRTGRTQFHQQTKNRVINLPLSYYISQLKKAQNNDAKAESRLRQTVDVSYYVITTLFPSLYISDLYTLNRMY